MRTKTDTLLLIMNILAWITCFGLIVKAGAILISYGISTANPDGAKNLYMGLNFYPLRQYDFWHYTGTVMLMALIVLSEAYIAYWLARVLGKIKMANPFTPEVARILERMSYVIILTWVAALLYNGHQKWVSKLVPDMQQNLIPTEFLFLAGVVFVIAQIFKKGVELQSETELTV